MLHVLACVLGEAFLNDSKIIFLNIFLVILVSFDLFVPLMPPFVAFISVHLANRSFQLGAVQFPDGVQVVNML